MSSAPQKKTSEHPKYTEMVKAAISSLKKRNGSSRQAIEKYIQATYKVGDNCGTHLKMALKRMSEKGILVHTKGVGATGSFKLNKAVKEEKPKKKPAKKPAAKIPAPKKTKNPKSPKMAAKSPKKTKKPAEDRPNKAAKKPDAKAKPTKKPTAKKPAKTAAKKPATQKSAKN